MISLAFFTSLALSTPESVFIGMALSRCHTARQSIGRTKMNAAVANASPLVAERSRFYVWMAGVFILVAFSGFTPTFWAPVAKGTFRAPPIIYIHGALLFTWTWFFFAQTALVAARRTLDHRAWGLAGISLFSVLMCSILVGEAAVLRRDELAGFGDAARRFSAVTLLAWPMMAGLFALAMINIKKPESHKRYMMVLMIGMMTPAIARVFITLFAPPGAAAAGPPPAFVALPPSLVADLLLVDRHRARLARLGAAPSGLCVRRTGAGGAATIGIAGVH